MQKPQYVGYFAGLSVQLIVSVIVEKLKEKLGRNVRCVESRSKVLRPIKRHEGIEGGKFAREYNARGCQKCR